MSIIKKSFDNIQLELFNMKQINKYQAKNFEKKINAKMSEIYSISEGGKPEKFFIDLRKEILKFIKKNGMKIAKPYTSDRVRGGWGGYFDGISVEFYPSRRPYNEIQISGHGDVFQNMQLIRDYLNNNNIEHELNNGKIIIR